MSGITRATAADAPAIASLLEASFAPYRRLYTEAGYAATTPPAQAIVARIDEGPIWIWRDTAIVGTVGAVRRGDDLYLRGMAVHPDARGRRLGRRLLESAESFALENFCRSLVLSTTPFLERAIALYEQWGFRRTNEPPHDLGGTPLVTMRKRLSRAADRNG